MTGSDPGTRAARRLGLRGDDGLEGGEMRAEDDFGWHLGTVLRAYHCEVATVLTDLPHVSRGYQVLTEVVHGDQPTQLALATHLGVDRTVMTYVIDDLVAAGLVERRQSPVDRRARKVVGTEHGAQVLARLERAVRAAEDRVLGTLDPADRETFRALLRRVACDVRDVVAGVDACTVARAALDETAAAR